MSTCPRRSRNRLPSGSTRLGVTSTSSSVFVRLMFLDLNSSPRIGMSANSWNLAELHGGALV